MRVMRRFYQRAVDRLDKIDSAQLHELLRRLVSDNELLGMVLDSMARGIIVTDTAGRILLVNRAAERLVPFHGSEYAERCVWEMISDAEIAGFLRDTLQRQENARDRDFTIAAGALRVLSFGVLPLVREGHVSGNLIYAEDVTEKRAAEARLRRAESLASLATLTAGVAHEIKNPLNFVKNFSEVSEELIEELREAIDDVGGAISDDQKSYIVEISDDLTGNLERIRSHGDRANRIVHDMLQMGRDTGEWQMAKINDLLEEHSRLAYHAARANDSDFQLDLKFDLDPEIGRIEVIPRDLSRVFLNMVGNAGDATDEKRRKLQAGEIQPGPDEDPYMPTLWISSRRGSETVEIRVKDNGMGIPPEVADKIFNPFFTTKPTDRGTGLGLAISNDIVREHGGTIRVESEPGFSTEMIIELPLEPPQTAQTEVQPAEV